MRSSIPATASAILATFLLVGCSSEGPTEPEATDGDIQVTTATTGDDIDPGYMVMVGSASQAITSSGSVTFADLTAGTYSVTLTEVADNCTVTSANPQSAIVVGGETTAVTFDVECDALAPPHTLVAADRDGNFYTLDEATGVETLFLDTFTDDGAGGTTDVGVVSSMHYIPSTQVWWLGTGGNAECRGCIQTLNLTTGLATTLADAPEAVSGLAVHPTTEKIYTFESDGTDVIYEIDATTGAYTELFSGLGMQNGGTGTTFSLDEVLYVAPRGELWTVDLGDGTPILIGALTYTGFPAFTQSSQTIGSMATRPSDGVVFGILKDGGNSGTLQPTFLVTINLATAEVTNVGLQTHLMDGLAFIMTALISG